MHPDGFEQRSWALPLSLSSIVDSTTMERLGVLGEGFGRIRLTPADADSLVEEAWEYIRETEEYFNHWEEGEDPPTPLRLDPTSVFARICLFRHSLHTRP